VAWYQELGLFYPGLGFAGGQVEYPGHQASGAAEPGDRTRPLRLQFGDHRKHPRIAPPKVGLDVTQLLKQPMNVGLSAILLNRGHETIVATNTDNFGPRETTQGNNPEM
jgi:hypothetical protein